MQSISLEQIQTASSCMRQYGYYVASKTTNTPTLTQARQISKDIIKQAYINRSQHSYNPEWDTLKSRINKACFEEVDVNNTEQFNAAYHLSIKVLNAVNHWYYKYFLSDTRHAIVNVPLSIEVSNSLVTDTVDVVLLDSKYQAVPIIFNDHDILPSMLYNNIRYKGLLWLLTQEVKTPVKLSEYIVNKDTISVHKLYPKTESLDNVGKYIKHIVKGIESEAFYPSVNEQCNTCPFKDICTI